MKDGLYHVEVFWEEEIQNQINALLNLNFPLKYDAHAKENMLKRGISTSGVNLEKLNGGYCFEAEVKRSKVIKFVIRYGYNDTMDLCSVWLPKKDCLYCKTIWLNEKDDKHYTLDANKYVSDNNEHKISHISVSISDLINQ